MQFRYGVLYSPSQIHPSEKNKTFLVAGVVAQWSE